MGSIHTSNYILHWKESLFKPCNGQAIHAGIYSNIPVTLHSSLQNEWIDGRFVYLYVCLSQRSYFDVFRMNKKILTDFLLRFHSIEYAALIFHIVYVKECY